MINLLRTTDAGCVCSVLNWKEHLDACIEAVTTKKALYLRKTYWWKLLPSTHPNRK